MPGTYPLSLRQRVVGLYEEGGYTVRSLAKTMRLGVATVQRWLRRKRESGTVAAKRQGGGFSPKIDEEGIAYLLAELAETPDLSLEDLAQRYTKNRHISVSRSAVLRALQRSGITRKKNVVRH